MVHQALLLSEIGVSLISGSLKSGFYCIHFYVKWIILRSYLVSWVMILVAGWRVRNELFAAPSASAWPWPYSAPSPWSTSQPSYTSQLGMVAILNLYPCSIVWKSSKAQRRCWNYPYLSTIVYVLLWFKGGSVIKWTSPVKLKISVPSKPRET